MDCLRTFDKFFELNEVEKLTLTKMKKADYSVRDQEGKLAFYVLLSKRKGVSLETLDEYWKNVHGPVCARLPGQHQYWQFHVAHNKGDLWPTIDGIKLQYKTRRSG